MTLISSPLLYGTVLLSIFYLVSVLLLGNISKNVIPEQYWRDRKDKEKVRRGYEAIIIVDVLARLTFFIFWFMIFVFACWFFNSKLSAVANEASGDPDTTTPIKRYYMLFAWFMVASAKFIFMYGELVFFKQTEVNPQGQEVAVERNGDIRLPLSYEEEDVQKMGAKSDSAVMVSKHQGMAFMRIAFLVGDLFLNVFMLTGWYKEKVRYPAAYSNPVIIGMTAMFVAMGLVAWQVVAYPQHRENGFISFTYLKRYGRVFGTNMQGMHGVWFLAHWLILALCVFRMHAFYEFYNDYPRWFFVTLLTVILPFLLSLATGTIGSFYYLQAVADVFFVMATWNVTVNYVGLPFDWSAIQTGTPTTSHQWYYWLVDWTNTNFQYRTRDTTGVVTYEGELGFAYFLAVAGLCLVFVGVLRTLWETVSPNGASKEETVSMAKKKV
jgi:hypothetical protein